MQDAANEPTPEELRAQAHQNELWAAGVASIGAGIIATLTVLWLTGFSL